MTIEERIFSRTKLIQEDLMRYGFRKEGNDYIYHAGLMDGAFFVKLMITFRGDAEDVFAKEEIKGSIIDTMTDEEYFQIRVESGMGGYVNEVRHAYEDLLSDIAQKCGILLPFVSIQANRITAAIKERYGEHPDFPWDGENKDAGVFRNPRNEKWYALVMHIEKSKLTQNPEDKDPVNIMNLKIRERDGDQLRRKDGIYPAWHMNHRTWISVVLDDSLTDEEILGLIDVSRDFTLSQGQKRKAGEKKAFIIPANPKYFDIISYYKDRTTSTWRQGKGIEAGDDVYIYVGVPYQSIMYRCHVTKAHISLAEHPEYDEHGPGIKEIMLMDIVDRYEEGKYHRKGIMASFGVTNVRGPRTMPGELAEYIQKAENE